MRPLYISMLSGLVAFQHLGFMVLEMFYWNKPIGLKVFKMSQQEADISAALAANQGLYNGFLAAGLVWGILYPEVTVGNQIIAFFLLCVIAAASYGAYSVSPRILLVQGGPALIAILLLRFCSGS